MKFIYQGEKPCVILFGDACDMGAYCTDLNYFDIKPELIITDAESFDDTWRGIPVRPFATIREYVGISNMVIVPIKQMAALHNAQTGRTGRQASKCRRA